MSFAPPPFVAPVMKIFISVSALQADDLRFKVPSCRIVMYFQ
jgi:hypothetical protein